MASRQLGKAKMPCQYFVLGCCKHDDDTDCNFSHDRSVCKPGSIMTPCKHYCHSGYCRNGQHCLFLHDDLERSNHSLSKTTRGYTKNATKAAFKKPLTNIRTVKEADTDSKLLASQLANLKTEDSGHLSSVNLVKVSEATDKAVSQAEYNASLSANESTYYYGVSGQSDEAKVAPAAETQAATIWSQYTKHSVTPQCREIDNFHNRVAETPTAPLCRFYQFGTCRFGDSCRYSHVKAPSTAKDDEVVMEEIEASRKLECGICLETVSESKDGRFGILQSCNHPYCLSCIRNWRGQSVNDAQHDSGMVKTCPLCRSVSYFVIPCNRMVTDDTRKKQLIAEYREKMQKIPCKHFLAGGCPFGNSCFYAHLNSDGSLAQNEVTRIYKTAEGATKAEARPTLFDFVKKR